MSIGNSLETSHIQLGGSVVPRDFPKVESGPALAFALGRLGWTHEELARRVGRHRNSVSAWVRGKVAVPVAVSAYVSLALKAKGLLE